VIVTETAVPTAPPSPPLTAKLAIARLRRDLALGVALKVALACVLVGAMIFGDETTSMAAFFAVGAAWVALTLGSRRGSALAAGSSTLIAAGLYDAAEVQLSQAIRGFSFFRSTKLMGLHHLALLRHTQQRWDESAALARALLGHRLGPLRALEKSARLMLAGACVQLGDLSGAYAAIMQLYTQRLALGEALHLLRTQSLYEAHIGAWSHLMHNAPVKVQLAELMPAGDAAVVQALLALAARKTGQPQWEQWLCARAGLLTDVPELTAKVPMLRELWA
jgi:hypothetical protein